MQFNYVKKAKPLAHVIAFALRKTKQKGDQLKEGLWKGKEYLTPLCYIKRNQNDLRQVNLAREQCLVAHMIDKEHKM